MGMCVDPGVFRWCQALSRSRSCTTAPDHESASRLALPPYQPGHHRQHPSTTTTTTLRRCSSSSSSSSDSQQQSQTPTTISTTNSKIQPVSNYNISHNASDNDDVVSRRYSVKLNSASPSAVRVKRSTVFDQYRKISRAEFATVCRGILRLLLLVQWFAFGCCTINPPQDAVHITAILGESVVFNCHVDFPGDHPVPYVLQWEKKVSEKGQEIPIFIWYESYPTHSGEGYEGRVSRVPPNSTFGAASLNLTDIRESDQGWYECKVVFLNRPPKQHKNGTWFHLDVHAPPRFSVTPEDIIYVNLGDSIILNCQADGTPTPEILWYKDANPVDPSSTVGIFNDGTELRISTIRHEDIGDYTCIARNGEGQVSHTARVIIAGGAVIMVPPTNQTKLEGEKVQFTCEAKAMPGNVTVRWFREGSPVREVAALETRVTIRKDGSLIINPVSADDSGQYTCEVSNGIGEPQSASAYLNIEYPAKVTFTPTIQYLPFRLAGVVQCYIKANPPLQYVTWTKDKRLLEPYQTKDIVIMNNGSLLFTRVNQNHQGRYTCTPYNAQGTQGSSGHMEVLVRKPPAFTVEPDPLYQRKVGESVEMHCDAQEAEGTSKPTIQWQRRDGQPLQKNRVRVSNGNITIENLRRSDFGYYQCVASNEVATIVSATQLVIEGTQPHAPYNLSGSATEFSVTLSWMPGYSGGPDYKQDYTIWYREAGVSEWSTIPVTPSGSTQVTINRLSPGTTYEFQVIGKNALGDGMMSKVITIRTLDAQKAKKPSTTTAAPNDKEFKHAPEDLDIDNYKNILFPTDSTGSTFFPPVFRPTGPKPGQPRNVSVVEIPNGFLISWQVPLERAHLVQFYTIKYRTDAQWKTLNRGQIRPEETSYLVKNLVGGRTYYFRVLANSLKSYETSDEIKFPVPARVKHKAITAGVVGGILFFIVAIILSICAVKICNKRKRRKQEKVVQRSQSSYSLVRRLLINGVPKWGLENSVCLSNVQRTQHGNGATNGPECIKSTDTAEKIPRYLNGKSSKASRLPGLNILIAILHWIWPPGRCQNCDSIYSNKFTGDKSAINVGQIHRSADGRFVLSQDLVDGIVSLRNSIVSQYSSSDDGGFLPKRLPVAFSKADPSAWVRPSLVAGVYAEGGDEQHHFAVPQQAQPQHHHHHHNHQQQSLYTNTMPGAAVATAAMNLGEPTSLPATLLAQTIYTTPSRVSKVVASSPATSSPQVVNSPWSPLYFSDLSSVHHPSSAERSFPTPQSVNSVHRYYNHELPVLQGLQHLASSNSGGGGSHHQHHHHHHHHAHSFIPVDVPVSLPYYGQSAEAAQSAALALHDHHQAQALYQNIPWGYYGEDPTSVAALGSTATALGSGGGGGGGTFSYGSRPKFSFSRYYPRSVPRNLNRMLPELRSPLLNLNLNTTPLSAAGGLENSPQSYSSSSGFGSKNTSSNNTQPTHHHQQQQIATVSGTAATMGHNLLREWRYLPPYRPPPPPPSLHHAAPLSIGGGRLDNPPYSMSHWLELITRLNIASEKANINNAAADVGSVDGHYEFDPSTPTPTASTPTGLMRDDFHHLMTLPSTSSDLLWSATGLGAAVLPSAAAATTATSVVSSLSGRKRNQSRYDNIDARVQAMKEEFYEYRKRQQLQAVAAGPSLIELESVC